MYDIVIKNGEILDGSGTKSYFADIGIKNGYISEISQCINDPALKVIDAKNHIVCPGFIDIDSHSDFSLYANPKAESKIRQGITTEIVGQGGRSLGPVNIEHLSDLKQYTKSYVQNTNEPNYWNWKTQYEFIDILSSRKTSVNIASLVGYGTIRVAVMGFEKRRPTNDEMNRMKQLLEDELINGIHGMSLGLDNSPDSLASIDELIEMAKVVKKYDGICSIHMREEGNYLFNSILEAIEISKKSGVKLQISHLKAAHPQNWGKVKEAISIINKAKNSGLNVDYDVYPYISYESVLTDVLPPWIRELSPEKIVESLKKDNIREKVVADMLDRNSNWGNPMLGSSWDRIRIVSMKKESNKKFEGMNIEQISEYLNLPPHDVVIDLLIDEGGVIKIIFSAMTESDLIEVMKQSMAIYSTDGLAVSPYGDYKDVAVHPRYYGTFPRILGRYVRQKKIVDIEEAIYKMTLLPAIKMNLKDRGYLAVGYKADITIFNKDTIIDESTYTKPHQYPVGIKDVIVNGVVVVENGEHTGELPGVHIKRK
ncbi:N-acyl-D-amino-acid deacylase family protein [Lutispora thermophila]|uniref:N-acyl-D-amino-acid deacylase n=1 Tax=Lutispora thermophila DSM 19022 TaxID=1122184 RepID=A0A1M6DVJ7_9FIRM|nr:amidohydrolase family protein [Lutispora thermophila]SHI77266.1 N-acyl-D-amino-acid deacylase [Lutispora thermophila DSM 19022]